MSFINSLNTKKRIGSIRNANIVVQNIIAYTEHQNIGMVLKVVNSLIMKIVKLGVETIVMFIDMNINELYLSN